MKSLNESPENLFTETDKLLLDSEHKRIEKYIKMKAKELKNLNIDGFNAGVVIAESYLSELGNELSKKYPELDFIAIVNSGSISYRTNKENVDVGSIAKKLGGGGHRKAAGSPISTDIQNEYFNKLFQIKKEGK